MQISKQLTLLLALIVLTAFGCGDDDGNGGTNACGGDFDQTAMLTNYADFYTPKYDELLSDINDLETTAAEFLAAPDDLVLSRLRGDLEVVYNTYSVMEMFEVGPAIDVDLRMTLNPFPTNETQVNELVDNGVPDNYVFSFDRGLPALEYLLYGFGDFSEIIARFEDRPENANARAYLADQIAVMKEAVATVANAWNGEYRATFIANTGTAAGGSLSQIINALNENWEITKRDRVGIPAGIATLGITNPETAEGRYLDASRSRLLLRNAILGSRQIFERGLKDYLDAIDAQKDGQSLSQLILDQYEASVNAYNEVEDPMVIAVENDQDDVADLYTELVRNIVLLKTDMPSLLCVAITYVDNPSDSD